MPDLLLELFSEEIPARMQARAADDLKKMVTDRLVAAGLVYEGARAFVTPRRLALTVHGVPALQPDVKEERKGPKVGAPQQAIAGFLRAAGLASIDQAKVQADKKGDFYVAVTEKKGRPAIQVIAEIVPQVVLEFPWPKSMRWGAAEEHSEESFLVTESGDRIVTEEGDMVVVDAWLRWVRPLHSIIATFGPETEEPEIVRFKIGGIESGNTTRGHRFMAPAPFTVKRFDDYVAKLNDAKVVLDAARRADMILTDAKTLAFAQGYELVEDEGLLAEVSGLVEWPVVLMGSFDQSFLAIPDEVIRATIRANQKCFVLRSPSSPSPLVGEVGAQRRVGGGRDLQLPPPPTPPHKEEGRLAPKFILVANEEATDGGKAIVAGNERVIRARLSDAKFFYGTDLKTRLEDRLPKFAQIVFHEKLGTQAERIARIVALAGQLAPLVGADVAKAERAAQICKADLLTEVVGEFPELQGLMGRYYAEAQNEDEAVAHAIEDHYKPKGPDDLVPADPVSIAVALADKIDTLVGFWAIDEKPTGSKDPYALRRAALGVIRIVLDNSVRLPFMEVFAKEIASRLYDLDDRIVQINELLDICARVKGLFIEEWRAKELADEAGSSVPARTIAAYGDIRTFFAERLLVHLRERGARYDLVHAVFALAGLFNDDILLIVRRVEALGKFLDTDDGKNLLAGVKRASNILGIEEKKDKRSYSGAPDAKLLTLPEEKALAAAVAAAKSEASAAVAKEDFAGAMTAIAKLRPTVDAFFDRVKVNDDDKAVRENRLKLLNEIREATRAVADFSKIEG